MFRRSVGNTLGIAAVSAVGWAGFWACDTGQTPAPDPAASACAMIAAQYIPLVANAAATQQDTSVTVMLPGFYYRIALQPSPTQSGKYLGFLRLAISNAGVYRLFFDAAQPVLLSDSAGNAVSASSSFQDSGVCAQVGYVEDFSLAAASYGLQIGTTDSAQVGFLAAVSP